MSKSPYIVYVGTYSEGTYSPEGYKSEGIYVCHMDRETGHIETIKTYSQSVNPTYLAIDEKNGRVFANNELSNKAAIDAYKIKDSSGQLHYLETFDLPGADLCHLAMSPDYNWVGGANYTTGSVIVCNADTGKYHITQLHGSSVSERQGSAHAHQVVFSHDKHVFVPDLGSDKIWRYQFDDQEGTLVPATPQCAIPVAAGEGPRHLVLSHGRDRLYVVTELMNDVLVFTLHKHEDIYELQQTVQLLPDNISQKCGAAGIILSPDEKYLFVSIRGEKNAIGSFRINQDNGLLEPMGLVDTRGKTPRHIGFTPDGRFLLSANQDSNTISVFRYQPTDGMLEFICHGEVMQPSFLAIVDPITLDQG